MASSDQPAKPPGDRLASYFENFFRTITGVSTLGASITFSKIVQAPVDPFHNYGFSSRNIQYLISLSWLFFVLALAFTSFFASALSLWRPQAVKAFGTTTGPDRVKVLWFATGVSAFLFGLEVVAFITISLVVAAYTGPVGWVAVGMMTVFSAAGFGVIIWRSPLAWPEWVRRTERGEVDTFERQMEVGGGREQEKDRYEESGGAGEQLPTMPKKRSSQVRQERRDGSGYDYGRSTSGEYRGQGVASQRQSRREDPRDFRYSRASTVTSGPYEPGTFGQAGLVYDDGIREGLVMSRYV